jgi:hypothetical protein
MTVYLGDDGFVEIMRTSKTEAIARDYITPDDVNVIKRRFSVQMNGANGFFLTTGDRVSIQNAGDANVNDGDKPSNEPLDKPWLLANHTDEDGKYYPEWTGYIGIDAMGGIRLFDTYEASIDNSMERALELAAPEAVTQLWFQQRNNQYRCLGGIRSYEFTTERETIDTTRLGDFYRERYEAGLISGQGTLNCLFNYRAEPCHTSGLVDFEQEFPIYLSAICVRIITGAEFMGRFVLHADNERAVFYESSCIVTNASVSVTPGQIIESSIQFVTTGTIQLRVGKIPGVLLQDGLGVAESLILQEDDSPIYLED